MEDRSSADDRGTAESRCHDGRGTIAEIMRQAGLEPARARTEVLDLSPGSYVDGRSIDGDSGSDLDVGGADDPLLFLSCAGLDGSTPVGWLP